MDAPSPPSVVSHSASTAPWGARQGAATWALVAFGLVALYAPTYWNAWNGIWQTEDMGHGPIILAVLVWLFWGVRPKLFEISERGALPARLLGWAFLVSGLLMYLFGRIFSVSSVEFASHILVVVALLFLLVGVTGLKVAWFPILYLIFLIPLPGTFVDAVTQPLKAVISVIVVEILHSTGYPIARSGVMITIGQYQMLVADACSGLHSLFSLSALGVLFMYITKRTNIFHNALMISVIVPVAFIANIIRVIILILITYYFGDEVGQGFIHEAAGFVLMLSALSLLFFIDVLLGFFFERFK